MQDFIAGKIKLDNAQTLFGDDASLLALQSGDALPPGSVSLSPAPIRFSPQALAVRNAALQVFRYYHKVKPESAEPHNVNASLYDIKAAFKGRNEKSKMNAKSTDETFNALMATLQESIKNLAKKIEPKIYEYGFLM